MSETPSYPALIELISRLEGKDKKTAEMALYCLNRLDEKEFKLFNEVQTLRRDLKTAIMGDSAELKDLKRENEKLRRAMHDIYEVYAGSDGMLYGTSQFYVRQLIKQMVEIAAEHKK